MTAAGLADLQEISDKSKDFKNKMKDFVNYLKNTVVPEGEIGLFFMGQAGFILKDSEGHLLAYDIYLSDCCEREFGFKRMLAKLLAPSEITFDAVMCSHGHYDHLDIDAIEELLKDESTAFYTTQDGVEEIVKVGMPETRATLIKRGEGIELFNGTLKANFVYCDHGELAPHAVGTVFEAFGKKIYFAGDTAYKPSELVSDITTGCAFAALPINGAFGNLNEKEACELAVQLKADVTVPCHFWNFAEHGGNPLVFIEAAKEKGINYKLMSQGEFILI